MAMQGPTAVLALVTGLKIGAFALIRLAVPLAPEAATELHWLLAGLGTVSLLFGAGAALAQTNLRAMLAYASVSHVGLVVLGLSSLSQAGVEGAVFQLLNFSLASGGLFLLAGLLHQRTGTLEAAQLGGAARRLPWIASFFLVLGLASIGVPGTSGFPAELMLLLAIFEDHAGAALAALAGAGMGAAAFLGLYRRLFFGPLTAAAVVDALDLKPSERRLFLLLVLLVLILGLMPGLLTEIMAPASRVWAARLP
jgi:NADH-quinone oxidoreductase subunit M